MGYIDVAGVTYVLDDGRVLLDNASFKVPTGSKMAIVGANGAGKITLLRLIARELIPQQGSIASSGKIGYMRQTVYSQLGPDATVADMLLSIAPQKMQDLAADIAHYEKLLVQSVDEKIQLRYASALVAFADAGGFDNYHQMRRERFARFEEQLKRWEEQHAKLRAQMLMYKQKAAYNSDMASRYRVAMTRLRKFEEVGRPIEQPREQQIGMRLKGSRTGKRAVVCQQLELTGLTYPWDTEVWYGERLAVLGANGSGKSHFLRLLAAGGTHPAPENMPINPEFIEPVLHEGTATLGARVRPGWFVQTHVHPEMIGRTLLDILHQGDAYRTGLDREAASRALGRYELAQAAEQKFESLSGGQQARFQIILLELSGANLLLLDEPTDNLDMQSAEALEKSLEGFEGTVIAVTHDRWFSRIFDRFLIYDPQGEVYESSEPVWI